MARPNKYNLQYFPLDVSFFEDHKLLMIEEDYGFKGGYIAIRLLAMVYEQGYYLDWEDNKEFSIAKRIGNGVASALVSDVLKSCLKHKLFDQSLFDKHMVLTSKGIQKRWLLVMTQLRRKVEIDSEFWLVSSEDKEVSSEETHPPITLSTQKEIKLNQTKQKETKPKEKVLPAKPPVPKTSVAKKAARQEVEPFWNELVAVWFAFGVEKFNIKPSFERDDPKIFKRIIQRLKKRAADQKVEWNVKSGPQRLRFYLEKAFEDKWLSENFLLSNLEKQFDKIIQNQTSKKPSGKRDIEYLFERFKDGDLDIKFILPEHFTELEKAGLAHIDEQVIKRRMKTLYGSNIMSETDLYNDYAGGINSKRVEDDKPFLMRLAVVEYFKKRKLNK